MQAQGSSQVSQKCGRIALAFFRKTITAQPEIGSLQLSIYVSVMDIVWNFVDVKFFFPF